MLYITQLSISALKSTICDRPSCPLQLQLLAEQIIYSSLMTLSTLLAPETSQQVSANGLDDVLLGRGTQIFKCILQMVPHLPTIFNDSMSYPDSRHFMNFIAGPSNRRAKPRTLLKLVLNTLNTAISKWQDQVRLSA